MIFASWEPLEVGSIVNRTFWIDKKQGRQKAQPFLIKREATRDEWLQFATEMLGFTPHLHDGQTHFYEVTTD